MTTTTKTWETMEPRERDVAVALLIGWRRPIQPRFPEDWLCPPGATLHAAHAIRVPNFTTTADADYLVLEKVRSWTEDQKRAFRVAFASIIEARLQTGRASGSAMFMHYEPGDHSHAAFLTLTAKE